MFRTTSLIVSTEIGPFHLPTSVLRDAETLEETTVRPGMGTRSSALVKLMSTRTTLILTLSPSFALSARTNTIGRPRIGDPGRSKYPLRTSQ